MHHARVLIALLLAASALAQGSCAPAWSSNAFVPNGTNGVVRALLVFDDGTGPALYAGGQFTVAGGATVSNVARWNGASWSGVGSGTNGIVQALAVFDDGTGPALYAGGQFASAGGGGAANIARWNGSAWSPLGVGVNGPVAALAVFAGSLYVGGAFSFAGGIPAPNVARFGAGGWSAAGSGLPTPPQSSLKCFAVHDDGSGAALYAGGLFPQFGANNIWKWNGSAWSMVGSGIITPSPFNAPSVNALAAHDDGGGAALFAGGAFSTAGGMPASNIAKWNGMGWTPILGGVNGPVTGLAAFDDGSGPALYVAGFISTANGTPVTGVAKWAGGVWSAVGSGVNGQCWAFAAWDDGSGAALFAGGGFSLAGGLAASNVARLSGAGWSSLGVDRGITGTVNALAVFDDGGGPRLFAGGQFTVAGFTGTANIAKLGPGGWTPIAPGIDGPVLALAVHDDGGGPALFAGGFFTTIGGLPCASIAKWNGTAWSNLGVGLSGGTVNALASFDDGTGSDLYVGGTFFNAGGVTSANHVARWNGSTWSMVGGLGTNGNINALTVLDDGGGTSLFAGGDFTTIGGVSANRVARWNGTWSGVGSGITGAGLSAIVYSLASYPRPSGPPRLVAGGNFTQAAGAPGTNVAIWNGVSWGPLGGGVDDRVNALRAFDDGAGPVLYAGGLFANAGGSPAARVARWSGASWSSVGDATGSYISHWVRSFAELGDGTGPALYAGGQFSAIGGVASLSVARRDPGGAPVVLDTLLPQIIYPGGPAAFSVSATGTHPISYQWRKNGGAIPGATGATHAIAAAAPGDAGTYDVAVTNACGSASSNAVTLSLIPGLGTFGTSTAGCAGFPFIGATSAPQIGNSSFALWVANTPPSQAGLCVVSGGRLLSPLWVSGLAAWIDPASPFLVQIPVASDPAGFCFIPAGLPPDPSLVGFIGYVQAAWTDPCAPGGLTASNALGLLIHP
jgi:hypothetical protein